MRILFTSYQKGFAGSAYSLIYLAAGLKEQGHHIFIAGVEGSIIAHHALQHNIPFTKLEKGFKYWDRRSIDKICELLRSERIQIVNAQSSRDRYALAAIKLFYKKDLVLVHTRRQRVNSKGLFLQNLLYNITATHMVAVSGKVRESMLRVGLNEKKATIINNGTPKEKYDHLDHRIVSEIKRKYQLGAKMVLGCVARKKLQIDLLRALKYLPEDLVVIFVGIHRDDLRSELKETNPSQRLIFTGGLSMKEVLHHYPLFDVNVLPSKIEGLSQSLLEAMALGVPVVATAAAGNPDLIKNGVNGFLYEKGDAPGLAKAVMGVMNMEENQRTELINNAKKTAFDDFGMEKVVLAYEDLFEQLLHKKRVK